jgi:hypothetical protein
MNKPISWARSTDKDAGSPTVWQMRRKGRGENVPEKWSSAKRWRRNWQEVLGCSIKFGGHRQHSVVYVGGLGVAPSVEDGFATFLGFSLPSTPLSGVRAFVYRQCLIHKLQIQESESWKIFRQCASLARAQI